MRFYRRAFLIWFLCSHEIHDTFPRRTGICKRCHLSIDENGNAR